MRLVSATIRQAMGFLNTLKSSLVRNHETCTSMLAAMTRQFSFLERSLEWVAAFEFKGWP